MALKNTAHTRRSVAVFNNRHMSTVVTAIDARRDPQGFTTRQIAVDTELPDSLIRPVLQRLLAAGVITELGRQGGARGALNYRAAKGPAWTHLLQLCQTLRRADRQSRR